MSTPNARDVLHVPGRLVKNPTSLSLVFPHGGTALGIVRAIVFKPEAKYRSIHAEEFGEKVEHVYIGEGVVVSAVLRAYDSDAIQTIFQNTSVGSVTGERVVNQPGSNRAGSLLSAQSIKLLFVPNDPNRHPGFVLYRALPMVSESAEFNFKLDEPFEIGMVFAGIRDTSNRVYQLAKFKDITL